MGDNLSAVVTILAPGRLVLTVNVELVIEIVRYLLNVLLAFGGEVVAGFTKLISLCTSPARTGCGSIFLKRASLHDAIYYRHYGYDCFVSCELFFKIKIISKEHFKIMR